MQQVFKELFDVIARLRGPGGCPWDLEQTPLTLRSDLLEETYECIEAINNQNKEHIKEELGDLFLLLIMISYMHEQEGSFTVQSVLQGIKDKLIRRHPHVFGDIKVKDTAEVLDNWAKIKNEKEGRAPKDSVLDEVKSFLHPLDKALAINKKAAGTGFDWPEIQDIYKKIEEEIIEVKESAKKGNSRTELETELGDLMFAVVNLCRRMDIDPSVALQRCNTKFTERFKYVEKSMRDNNYKMEKNNLNLMDKFWEEAKNN